MKERSVNELFRNVQKRANWKQTAQPPPLVSISTSREKDLASTQTRKDSYMSRFEPRSLDSSIESQTQSDVGPWGSKDTHTRTLKRMFKETNSIEEDEEVSSHEKVSSRMRDNQKVPALQDFIPISHLQADHTRRKKAIPNIRIVNDSEQSSSKLPETKFISETAEMALRIFGSIILKRQNEPEPLHLKSAPEILKAILTNPSKLQLHLRYLQEQAASIASHNRRQLAYSQKENHQTPPNKKGGKSAVRKLKLLSCLLVKLRESSIKNNQTIPQVSLRDGKLEMVFDTRGQASHLYEKKQKVALLQKQLEAKDQFIHGIKYEYDKIVNNYAKSLANLEKGEEARGEMIQEEREEEYDGVSEQLESLGETRRSFRLNRKHTFGGTNMLESSENS